MRWRLVMALLLVFPALSMAVEVYLAPFGVLEETEGAAAAEIHPEADLQRALAGLADAAAITPRMTDVAQGETVHSLLGAAQLCQAQGYGLLLYGFCKRGELSYTAEVKLFDAEAGTVAASFFAADDRDHYARLMRDLAERIYEYFTTDPVHGVVVKRAASERNRVALPLAMGYWVPAGGEWSNVLEGLGAATLGFRFTPRQPLFKSQSLEFEMAFGLEAEYQVGVNQPGYESFYLHTVHVVLPIELGIQASQESLFALSVGPLFSLDILSQDRLYASRYVGMTSAAGVSVSALYRYEVTRALTLGCATTFDAVFYDEPLFTVSPRLFIELTPGRDKGGEKP